MPRSSGVNLHTVTADTVCSGCGREELGREVEYDPDAHISLWFCAVCGADSFQEE